MLCVISHLSISLLNQACMYNIIYLLRSMNSYNHGFLNLAKFWKITELDYLLQWIVNVCVLYKTVLTFLAIAGCGRHDISCPVKCSTERTHYVLPAAQGRIWSKNDSTEKGKAPLTFLKDWNFLLLLVYCCTYFYLQNFTGWVGHGSL